MIQIFLAHCNAYKSCRIIWNLKIKIVVSKKGRYIPRCHVWKVVIIFDQSITDGKNNYLTLVPKLGNTHFPSHLDFLNVQKVPFWHHLKFSVTLYREMICFCLLSFDYTVFITCSIRRYCQTTVDKIKKVISFYMANKVVSTLCPLLYDKS